jgi:clathrin heavy chain
VNFACVRAQEFKVAQECGIHVINHPDHLESVCNHYEKFGYVSQLISLLVHGQQEYHNKTNNISTELGILYAKYNPENLLGHIVQQDKKINIPMLIRVC